LDWPASGIGALYRGQFALAVTCVRQGATPLDQRSPSSRFTPEEQALTMGDLRWRFAYARGVPIPDYRLRH
jgi:hypothetical protein